MNADNQKGSSNGWSNYASVLLQRALTAEAERDGFKERAERAEMTAQALGKVVEDLARIITEADEKEGAR